MSDLEQFRRETRASETCWQRNTWQSSRAVGQLMPATSCTRMNRIPYTFIAQFSRWTIYASGYFEMPEARSWFFLRWVAKSCPSAP